MGHGRRHRGCKDGPAPFGALAARTAGLTGLAEDALAAVTVEDMRVLLNALTPAHARDLLAVVRLGAGKKAVARNAETLLRALRKGGPRRRTRRTDPP